MNVKQLVLRSSLVQEVTHSYVLAADDDDIISFQNTCVAWGTLWDTEEVR